MAEAMRVHQMVYTLNATDWAGDNVKGWIMKAPEAGDGSGITILRAYIIDQTAHGAGTAYLGSLFNYGTAGTAVEGTIGTVGGTADPIAAATPKAFTLTAAQKRIDAGEWIVFNKDEENSQDPLRGSIVIEYVFGG